MDRRLPLRRKKLEEDIAGVENEVDLIGSHESENNLVVWTEGLRPAPFPPASCVS
jgi:hypothetical protein